MFRFLSSKRTAGNRKSQPVPKKTSRRKTQPRLSLEELEDRSCPSLVTIPLNFDSYSGGSGSSILTSFHRGGVVPTANGLGTITLNGYHESSIVDPDMRAAGSTGTVFATANNSNTRNTASIYLHGALGTEVSFLYGTRNQLQINGFTAYTYSQTRIDKYGVAGTATANPEASFHQFFVGNGADAGPTSIGREAGPFNSFNFLSGSNINSPTVPSRDGASQVDNVVLTVEPAVDILRNSVHVTPSGATIRAVFQPMRTTVNGTKVPIPLRDLAAALGGDHFNWVQQITHIPSTWKYLDDHNRFLTPPNIYDPSTIGGYTVVSSDLSLNPNVIHPSTKYGPFDNKKPYFNNKNIATPDPFINIATHTTSTALGFEDMPWRPAGWFGPGDYMQFRTRLALVDAQENVLKMWDKLGTNFNWKTNGIAAQPVGGNDSTDPDDPTEPEIISGGVFDVQLDTTAAPAAAADAGVTAQNVPITLDVLANDTSDPAVTLDPTVVDVTTLPAHGTVSIDPNTGAITYTPAIGFLGLDTFAYTVSDTVGQITDPVTVTIDVVGSLNQAPSVDAIPDQATAPGHAVTFTAVGSDPDSADALTYHLDSTAPDGAAINPSTGVFSWTPTPAQGDRTYTFAVRVTDSGTPNLSAVRNVTITVANSPPSAQDDSISTVQDMPVFIPVLNNDDDPDGVIDPESLAVVVPPTRGTVSLQEDGTVLYTPASGFSGTDIFTYMVKDDQGAPSNTATVTITVTPGVVNQPPVANADSETTLENLPVTINVLDNDTDPDGSIDSSSVAVASQPANGTATVDPFTGAITYTPANGFAGIDTFTYTVRDDNGDASDPATVSVTVAPNQPPVAVDDQRIAFSGLTTRFDVLANDRDPVGSLVPTSLTITGLPMHGTATVNTSTGEIIYTPAAGFVGTDTLRYTVEDNSSATSNEATVSITVYQSLQVTPLGANDPSTLVNALLAPDPRLSVDLNTITYIGTADQAGTYTDLNYPPTLSIENGTILTTGSAKVAESNDSTGATGQGSYAGDADLSALIDGTPTYGANVLEFDFTVGEDVQSIAFDFIFGSEEFPEFVGQFNDVFGVFLDGQQIAFDSDGKPITVNNNFFRLNNTYPLDTSDPSTVGKTVVDLKAIEYDGLTPRLTTSVPVTPGLHHIKFAIADAGDNVLDSGVFLANFRASTTGGGGPVTGQPPVADSDQSKTTEGTPVTIDVLANDSDPDGDIDPSTVAIASAPANGLVSVDAKTGKIVYTPHAGFSGTDTFTYTVKDNNGVVSNEATVTVDVAPPSSPPPAVTDVRVRFGSQSYSLLGNNRTLPWTNITAIDIVFNQDVVIDQNDLQLAGVNISQYGGTFSYNAAMHTATWTLASPITRDRLTLSLDGDGVTGDGNDGIRTTDGVFLQGGDYTLGFNVLAGDYNGDGVVTIQDSVAIRNHSPGYGLYDIFADLDGDGDIDINDINAPRQGLGWKLP